MSAKYKMSNLAKCEEFMRKVFDENNQEFFSYAWREQLLNFLLAESKYNALLQWVKERISQEFITLNTLNPADKDGSYKQKDIQQYLKACETVANLLNAQYIIMSDTCTTKMRENLEYTLCKLYNIEYNKELGYLPKIKKD